MAKTKARFCHPIATWVPVVKFSATEIERLGKICDKSGFVDDVANLTADYCTTIILRKQMPRRAEVRATLKEIQKSTYELKRKLEKLHGGASAHLYKVSGKIEAAKENLQAIHIETHMVLHNFPSLGAGRPKGIPEHQAAEDLKRLFEQYSIKWTGNTWPGANCPAIVVLDMVFRKGGKVLIEIGEILEEEEAKNISPEAIGKYL